jgi:formylglycine-generating enzyme required for sulfatase activity
MAPEQAVLTQLGKPVHPDVRWDVYALGATLTAILTGGAPHESAATTEALKQAENLEERLERYRAMVDGSDDNNTTARGKLDADLAAIIDKCLTPTAEGRYPSMAAVLADLEARRKNRPVSPLAHRRGYRLAKFVRRNPLGLSLFAAVVVLFASLASSSLKNREIDRGTAEDAIAAFAQNPTDGLRSSEQSGPRVLAMATDYAGRYVNSPAAPQRVMGARSAPWLNPDAFWRSVDGGMLWHHGEWLELCRANHPWPDAERFVNSLRNMAVNGTPRQKYVAFCLIGERPELCKDLTPQCVDAVKSETEPGVATAAYWAAKQLGHQGDITTGDAIVEDETSGLWFVQLPAEEAFVRGSEPDEVGHEPHENKNQNAPVAISPIYMSTTEATCTAMAPFFQSPAFTNTFKGSVDEKAYDNTAISVETVFGSVPADVSSRAGMGGLRMDVARLYCTWLTERAKDAQPPRRYRLPTEDEWEYACRGGNDGRFCFGDDADYVEYFAACETIANYHTSGTRRPNMYGLFDMHGGLWEWCESRYTARDAAQMSVNLDPNAVLYILRGGGYYSPAKFCRSAQRHYSQPTRLDLYTGMRLVMEAATP